MDKSLIASLALLALLGCGPPDDKAAKLEAIRREAYAQIIRHEGECKAIAFEFQDRALTENCLETHRWMIAEAQKTDADISKRLDEINRGR